MGHAYLYGLSWRRWGEARAYGRGNAAANNCEPSCAGGRYLFRRGARVTLYRLRNGDCNGEPVRFYTRALLRFPARFARPYPQRVSVCAQSPSS